MRLTTALLVTVAALVVVAGAPRVSAYQAHADPSNPGVFQVNGTCFDICKSYPWPATVFAGKYKFVFNPCKPVPQSTPCYANTETAINSTTPRGDQPGIALCQSWHTSSTTINYASGGLLEPLAIWNGDYPYNPTSMRKAVMQVNYPYGAAWRNTVLTVMQTESENATFAFQGEAPLMQYNFVLQGKNVFNANNENWPCFKQFNLDANNE